MKILFIGNYQSGYVGEVADETHITREMETLGHTVYRVPRDEWREYVIEKFPKDKYPNVPENIKPNIAIICKWNHFYDGTFIKAIKEKYNCNCLYFVWDYMWDTGFPDWHLEMAQAADLYVTNEYGIRDWYKEHGVENVYYFPFDVADGDLPLFQNKEKLYDVAFFGSCIEQGDRIEWLTEINKTHPVKIFSWNYQDWEKRGFNAEPAVYGVEFMERVAQSKIILGFSVSPHTWGYWSNRVGKTLLAGGFLLYQYAPGMELFLRDGVEYFSSVDEVNEKISYYLKEWRERERIADRGLEIAKDRFTSKARVAELMIFIERYLKEGGSLWEY